MLSPSWSLCSSNPCRHTSLLGHGEKGRGERTSLSQVRRAGCHFWASLESRVVMEEVREFLWTLSGVEVVSWNLIYLPSPRGYSASRGTQEGCRPPVWGARSRPSEAVEMTGSREPYVLPQGEAPSYTYPRARLVEIPAEKQTQVCLEGRKTSRKDAFPTIRTQPTMKKDFSTTGGHQGNWGCQRQENYVQL